MSFLGCVAVSPVASFSYQQRQQKPQSPLVSWAACAKAVASYSGPSPSLSQLRVSIITSGQAGDVCPPDGA